jgi:hypothetical protein
MSKGSSPTRPAAHHVTSMLDHNRNATIVSCRYNFESSIDSVMVNCIHGGWHRADQNHVSVRTS